MNFARTPHHSFGTTCLWRRFSILAALLTVLFSSLPATSLAADVYARGHTTGSVVLGAGRALDRDYTILGATLGYMVADGLMLGISGQMWLGNDPDIYKITPDIRYTFPTVGSVRPYVGAFISTTIYDDLPDSETYGARGGIAIPFSSNAAMNVGVVYEKVVDCDTATYNDCSQVYTEASILFSF
ncbi:MAG: hypothetical protein ACKVP2_05825 [Burkholderiales bacterium]